MPNNKTVTFGEVIAYPEKPDPKKAEAKKAEAEKNSIKNRFNCGVLRSSLKLMAGGNGNHLIAIRLVRSKLRKREDNLHTTAPTTNHNNNVICRDREPLPQPQPEVVVSCPSQESLPPPFLWTNSRCSTTASSLHTLYNNDEDTLVHSLACEEPRECKGFRKNLSGKWRRLVKKKPPQEVYTLPTELRDQLKTIYVY